MKHTARQHCFGFTLIEILVTVTIVAVIAVVLVPQFRNNDRLRVVAAAQILASDIEAAQVHTISYPDDPVLVKFNPKSATYWLASTASPDTPITHQMTGEPYKVTLGQGRASSASEVTMTLTDVSDNTIEFNESGGLVDFTTVPVIALQCHGETIEVVVSPSTGTVIERQPGAGGKSGVK